MARAMVPHWSDGTTHWQPYRRVQLVHYWRNNQTFHCLYIDWHARHWVNKYQVCMVKLSSPKTLSSPCDRASYCLYIDWEMQEHKSLVHTSCKCECDTTFGVTGLFSQQNVSRELRTWSQLMQIIRCLRISDVKIRVALTFAGSMNWASGSVNIVWLR